ncbi:hypothetical protein JBE04_43500, partial [Streptomyces sp. PRKS01-29]|nr:hypothetical protein [Streptomyces sabulosicollis]
MRSLPQRHLRPGSRGSGRAPGNRAIATGVLVVAAAMIGVGFQSGSAAARPDDSAATSANVADRPAARTIS